MLRACVRSYSQNSSLQPVTLPDPEKMRYRTSLFFLFTCTFLGKEPACESFSEAWHVLLGKLLLLLLSFSPFMHYLMKTVILSVGSVGSPQSKNNSDKRIASCLHVRNTYYTTFHLKKRPEISGKKGSK